jgi:hypothetical protein
MNADNGKNLKISLQKTGEKGVENERERQKGTCVNHSFHTSHACHFSVLRRSHGSSSHPLTLDMRAAIFFLVQISRERTHHFSINLPSARP